MAKEIYPIFRGEVKSGNLQIYKRDQLNEYVKTLKDGYVEIVVRPERKIRSLDANNYYWGVLIDLIAKETGMTPHEVHEALGSEFRVEVKEVIGKDGKVVRLETRRSTSDMTSAEFEEYLARCRPWASEVLNVYIPLPNEIDYGL